MSDEQSIVHREHPKNESHAFGFSLRGWIALILTLTLSYVVVRSLPIPEQFSNVVMFVLGYYFAKQPPAPSK